MNLNLTTATRYGLNVLALLGLSIALYLGRSIFVPLTVAVLLAAILYPSCVRLHKGYGLPWFLACLTTVLVVVVFMLVPFTVFIRAIPGVIADLPRPNDPVAKREFYNKVRTQVLKVSPFDPSEAFPEEAENSGFYQYVSKTFDGEYITNALLDTSKLVGDLLLQGVLILFILLFLLVEGEMLARKVRNIFGPGPDVQRRVTAALAEMAEAVRAYLVWRTVVNLGLAIVLGFVYHAVGLKQPILWALATFVLCYIPYLGTIAAGILPVLDAILNVGPGPALGILVFYIAVVTFEGYLIVPWVMGRSMDLNATTVIMSCLFWDYVWGTAGLFLAMPLMAAIKAVCLQVDGWRPWGLLMGSGPVLPDDLAEHMVTPSVVDLKLEEDSLTDADESRDGDKTDVLEASDISRDGTDRMKKPLPSAANGQGGEAPAAEYPTDSPNR